MPRSMHISRTTLMLLWLIGCGSSTSTTDPILDAGGRDADGPDANGGSASPVSAEACLKDLAAPDRGFVNVQRFRSADGKVKVARARQTFDPPTPPIGETYAYMLVRFWIQTDTEPGTCVRGKTALTYAYAHHNWNETWKATTTAATYEGSELFEPTDSSDDRWNDSIRAKDAQGKLLWGPIDLLEDGCSSQPYDLNPCLTRTRSDKPPPCTPPDRRPSGRRRSTPSPH